MENTYKRKVNKSLIPTCNIMGVNIAAINMEWLVKYLNENLADIKGDYICVSNVHTTVTSYEDASYCAVQNGGLMAIPDGGPLSTVGQKRGHKNMARTTGPSLMGEIFKISAEKGYRHYFYGSKEETLEILNQKLTEKYPGIQIAGMYSPPFRPLTKEEDDAVIERINKAKPDFVWIGLGAPKQEKWMAAHQGKIDGLMLGVGAGFDYYAENIKRAPMWMQKSNLECKNIGIEKSVVISIQGLVSKYFYHYYAYLPHYVVVSRTLRDLIKGNVADGAKEFKKRGELEKEAICGVKHVIGRTEWDRACAWDINPNLEYHFNNETLRDEFYSGQWSYDACEKHSIFCSQGHYPIKGIHLVIEALYRVVKEYPDAHLYIGGKDYLHLPFWKQSGYGAYLVSLIKRYNLEKNITFTGFLNASQMKNRYLKANIFVSASSIENSPNSLGEAMLLGVPCISSRVGGVHNLMEHGKEGYVYPADETYMLAYYICNLFENHEKASEFGMRARAHAMKTHDAITNREELAKIYLSIIREEVTDDDWGLNNSWSILTSSPPPT